MDRAAIHGIIEELQTGILVTDAELEVVYANAYESAFYRLPKDELIGRNILEQCHKPSSREVIREMVESMKAGEMDEHAKFAVAQLIRYKALRNEVGEFAGIVRTRMWLPPGVDADALAGGRRQESE